MNNKIIWGVVVVVIICGLFFFLKWSDRNTNYGDSVAQMSLLTADWNTYTNKSGAFSLKYPNIWDIRDKESDTSGNVPGVTFYSKDEGFPIMSINSPIREVGYETLREISSEKLIVNDKSLKKTTYLAEEGENKINSIHVTWDENSQNRSGEIWFHARNQGSENMFDLVLSTFKFTN